LGVRLVNAVLARRKYLKADLLPRCESLSLFSVSHSLLVTLASTPSSFPLQLTSDEITPLALDGPLDCRHFGASIADSITR
jgi:hypothetical protein